ncbi:Putative platelet-activating factor acetylhydrolase, alpha/Beta hydrolase, chlorophyllase enzyme [Septoria linicola]|uniref:1-alkyl-2-acetylglycerophosphocholine esterase n=1 Tax=Septoria linicola TaxID=215465 RepID=A0A9Q9ENX3_9PEZI|nr:Putative platelet-activating factor acetylhydrolase, alpha/Beta hydrolase, chlorophyllase enzyme [Septoria linicola]
MAFILALLQLSSVGAAQSSSGSSILLPSPEGPYGTNIKIIEAIHHSRTDPYDPSGGPRRLMTSVFYPTGPIANCQAEQSQYIPTTSSPILAALLERYGVPNMTAPLKNFVLPVCEASPPEDVRGEHDNTETFPVVLFSHGLQTSRLLSSSQAQAVASYGYVVITIDHPFDAWVVVYADGTVVRNAQFATPQDLDEDINVRSKDASFIADQLSVAGSAFADLPIQAPVEQVGIFGHSLGGASSARAAFDDERFAGAVDLDGYPYGFNTTGNYSNSVFEVPQIDAPFLLLNGEDEVDLPPYVQFFDAFTQWKKQLGLAGAQHLTFTDVSMLVDAAGLRDRVSEDAIALVGMLDGRRARDIVASYVAAFMDMAIKKKDAPLLEGPDVKYPEVAFVR